LREIEIVAGPEDLEQPVIIRAGGHDQPFLAVLPAPLDLSQAHLYIYNFLDIRENLYRGKVLDEIEGQLIEWLEPRTEAATIIRSQQTPYILERDAYNWQADISSAHEVDRVPVMQTIASNDIAEAQFGADHQLIIFLSSFTSSGSWRYYTIRFVLIRKSDNIIWEYIYGGERMVLLSERERSKSRAEKIITELEEAMAADGIIIGMIPEPDTAGQ